MTKDCLPVGPVLQNPEAPWRHAVDAPVGDPGLVTDGHREATVVSSHHFYHMVRRTGQRQLAALARVRCLHRGRRAQGWKRLISIFLSIFIASHVQFYTIHLTAVIGDGSSLGLEY